MGRVRKFGEESRRLRVGRAVLAVAAILIVGFCAGMVAHEGRWPLTALLLMAPVIAGGWGLALKPNIATSIIGCLFMAYAMWIGANLDEAHWKKMPWTGPSETSERVIAGVTVVLSAAVAWTLPRAFKWVIGEGWGV